jgi:hypothetical protein
VACRDCPPRAIRHDAPAAIPEPGDPHQPRRGWRRRFRRTGMVDALQGRLARHIPGSLARPVPPWRPRPPSFDRVVRWAGARRRVEKVVGRVAGRTQGSPKTAASRSFLQAGCFTWHSQAAATSSAPTSLASPPACASGKCSLHNPQSGRRQTALEYRSHVLFVPHPAALGLFPRLTTRRAPPSAMPQLLERNGRGQEWTWD